MPSPKVIQLRQSLSERFPGLRMQLEDHAEFPWQDAPSSGSQIDDLLQNRMARGALNEIVAGPETSGSATLVREIIHRAVAGGRIAGLVDGGDSFEVTQMADADLPHLLWVRCSDAEQAVKAADLLLRDGNLPLVIVDLKFNPENQLRGIGATTWYRLQRLVETTSAVCVIVTPRACVAPARVRITLHSRFSPEDLLRDSDELMETLKMDVDRAHHFHKAAGQKIA